MAGTEKKLFGDQATCLSDANNFTLSRLNVPSFSGLFLIIGCVSSLDLLIFFITFLSKEWDELKATASQSSLWRKIVEWWHRYDRKDLSSYIFKEYATNMNDGGSHSRSQGGDTTPSTPNGREGLQSPVSMNIFYLIIREIGEGL